MDRIVGIGIKAWERRWRGNCGPQFVDMETMIVILTQQDPILGPLNGTGLIANLTLDNYILSLIDFQDGRWPCPEILWSGRCLWWQWRCGWGWMGWRWRKGTWHKLYKDDNQYKQRWVNNLHLVPHFIGEALINRDQQLTVINKGGKNLSQKEWEARCALFWKQRSEEEDAWMQTNSSEPGSIRNWREEEEREKDSVRFSLEVAAFATCADFCKSCGRACSIFWDHLLVLFPVVPTIPSRFSRTGVKFDSIFIRFGFKQGFGGRERTQDSKLLNFLLIRRHSLSFLSFLPITFLWPSFRATILSWYSRHER